MSRARVETFTDVWGEDGEDEEDADLACEARDQAIAAERLWNQGYRDGYERGLLEGGAGSEDGDAAFGRGVIAGEAAGEALGRARGMYVALRVVLEEEPRLAGRRGDLDAALEPFGAGGARVPRELELMWAPEGAARPGVARTPRAGRPRRAPAVNYDTGGGSAGTRAGEPSVRRLVEGAARLPGEAEPLMLVGPASVEALGRTAEDAARALDAVVNRWMADLAAPAGEGMATVGAGGAPDEDVPGEGKFEEV